MRDFMLAMGMSHRQALALDDLIAKCTERLARFSQ